MSDEMQNEPRKTDPMNEFERRLAERMRPVNAPESLAKFLAIAVEAEEKRRQRGRWISWFKPKSVGGVLVRPRPMAWTGAAMAAAVLLAVFVGEQVHVRQERERAERATQQFEAAMRIENQALEHTRAELARAGIRLEQ